MPVVTHIITGLEVGGAERALYNLLTNGLEGPFCNRVISLTGFGHYGPLLVEAGIPVETLDMPMSRPSLSGMRRLIELCSTESSDIIQGWMVHGNLAATFARCFASRRSVLVWNIRISTEAMNENKRATRLLTHMAARLSTQPKAIMYNSLRSQRQYKEIGYSSARSHYLPNGFDTGKWYPSSIEKISVRQELGIPNDTQVIGFVGRGDPQKNISNLFSAFKRVAAINQKVVLVAVGRKLDSYAFSSDQVILLGQRADVPKLMRAFDILCLSSKAEGFPNVIGEAMATGVPCVATDVGDVSEIINNTGWVVPSQDSEALADAMIAALKMQPDKASALSSAARAHIVQNYSISTIASRYLSLYEKLILDNN